MNRIDALKQKAFEKKNFNGFLITNNMNLFYLSGVLGASCLLIPQKGESIIYVYGVDYEQAKADGKGFRIELVKRGESLLDKVAAQAKACHITSLALDMISVGSYRDLARGLKGKAKLKIQGNLVSELRQIKDNHELELMRKAAALTATGMKAASELIKPGIKEIDVAAEIEYAMRKKGSWGTAFETSVASGVRSAFPHGGCTEKAIKRGDLVIVDIGATYHRYCSDMTRTFVAGKPSAKQKKIYEVVKNAHQRALQTIKARAKTKDVDIAARKVIDDAGYGKFFVHGLGHGVGLEVHESPTLSQSSKEKLVVGNVVTNEPGIYIVGFGGVRIEDSVLVQRQKAEKLTDGLYTLEAGC